MGVTFSVPSELAQFASLYLCETWGCPDDSNGIQHEYVDLQRLCQQHFGWEFLGRTLMDFLFLFKQGFQEVQFFLVPEPACATKKLFFEYVWFIACIHDIQIRQFIMCYWIVVNAKKLLGTLAITPGIQCGDWRLAHLMLLPATVQKDAWRASLPCILLRKFLRIGHLEVVLQLCLSTASPSPIIVGHR